MSEEAPKIDELLTGETIEKATDSVAGLLENDLFQSQSLIEIGIIVIQTNYYNQNLIIHGFI